MRALRLEAFNELNLLEVDLPVAEQDDILLKVSHCALCRTDAKMFHQGQRDLVLPRILGHEVFGFNEQTGERFVIWPGEACGVCEECLKGHENLCSQMRIMGFHRDGGFAEYLSVSKSSVIPVPENLPGHLACLAEPLASTLNALEQARVEKNERILIYGGGPVGLLMSLAAQSLGATAFVVEKNPPKLRKSEKFRSSLAIEGSPECRLKDFDVVVNAAPSLSIFHEGMSKLRSGGCFCLFSGFTGEGTFPVSILNEIHYRQLRLAGAYGSTRRHMKKAVLLLNLFQESVSYLVEEVIELDQIPLALEAILSGDTLKFVAKI